LKGANLRDGDLRNVDLEYATSRMPTWKGPVYPAHAWPAQISRRRICAAAIARSQWADIAAIKLANVFHVKNPPRAFLDWAMSKGALAIEPSRMGKVTNAPR